MHAKTITLPGVCIAAAGGGDTAWCGAGDRLLGFSSDGDRKVDALLPNGLTQLAAAGTLVVAIVGGNALAWIEPASGRVLATSVVGTSPQLCAGGGAVWVVDRASSRAWRVRESGKLDPPRAIPGVDNAAAGGDHLWWTSATSTGLHDLAPLTTASGQVSGRTADIGIPARDRGAMVVCAGSVWVSVPHGLARAGAWDAKPGLTLQAPEGPVPFLACAGGALAGASRDGNLFVLDPLIDADVRALGNIGGGRISHFVATNHTAWAFIEGKPEATVIRIREA